MMETAAPQEPIANGISSPTSLVTIDPDKVVEHLAAVVTIALGATHEDLEREGSLLSPENYADTVQRCTRFASDSQVALYIQKEVVLGANIADGPLDNGT